MDHPIDPCESPGSAGVAWPSTAASAVSMNLRGNGNCALAHTPRRRASSIDSHRSMPLL